MPGHLPETAAAPQGSMPHHVVEIATAAQEFSHAMRPTAHTELHPVAGRSDVTAALLAFGLAHTDPEAITIRVRDEKPRLEGAEALDAIAAHRTKVVTAATRLSSLLGLTFNPEKDDQHGQ